MLFIGGKSTIYNIVFVALFASCYQYRPIVLNEKKLSSGGSVITDYANVKESSVNKRAINIGISTLLTSAYLGYALSDSEIGKTDFYVGAVVFVGSSALLARVNNKSRIDTLTAINTDDFSDWLNKYSEYSKKDYVIVDSAYYNGERYPIILDRKLQAAYADRAEKAQLNMNFDNNKLSKYQSVVDINYNIRGFGQQWFYSKLEPEKQISMPSIAYTSAFSTVKYRKNDAVSGFTNVVFYDKNNLPIVVYIGNVLNGKMDGLGVLISKNNLEGGYKLYQGTFANGEYIGYRFAYDEALKAFDLIFKDSNDINDFRVDLETVCLQSDIIDTLSYNEFYISAMYRWVENNDEKYAKVELKRKDFYSAVDASIIDADRNTKVDHKSLVHSNDKDELLIDILDFVLKGDDIQYDSLTYIELSSWNGKGYSSCRNSTANSPLFGIGDDEDGYRDATVYIRDNPYSKWNKVATWTIERVCRGDLGYIGFDEFYNFSYKTNADINYDNNVSLLDDIIDYLLQPTFGSEREVINVIVDKAYAEYEGAIGEYNSEQKVEYARIISLLFERVGNMGDFMPDKAEPRIGVWLDDDKQNLILVGHTDLKTIPIDIATILNEFSYFDECEWYRIIEFSEGTMLLDNMFDNNTNTYNYKLISIDENILDINGRRLTRLYL
ncbi:MAG: hypothetical protein KDE33_19325 [Bacteroidetes bacterium]|nr:hypothetical protein [Bacteroidota bacterium]